MADILHDLPLRASRSDVFRAIATPQGLDAWWTQRATGEPTEGAVWELCFGPDFDWRATVSRCVPEVEFELLLTRASEDWVGTRVGFRLDERNGVTQLRFHHTGWQAPGAHYRTSSYCWALYLRLLKRHVETGERVPYEGRLDA